MEAYAKIPCKNSTCPRVLTRRAMVPTRDLAGLTSEQFDDLIERVGYRVGWNDGRGRPRVLTLHQAVKAVVMYFRTNITQEMIAELLFVDQTYGTLVWLEPKSAPDSRDRRLRHPRRLGH
jgi:hypothetical protein